MLPSGCGLYRIYLFKKYLNETIDVIQSSSTAAAATGIDNSDTISHFDLIMDDLVDCRFINNDKNNNNNEQLYELGLYIQKNSRLKLILLTDCNDEGVVEKYFKLENIFKIVSFSTVEITNVMIVVVFFKWQNIVSYFSEIELELMEHDNLSRSNSLISLSNPSSQSAFLSKSGTIIFFVRDYYLIVFLKASSSRINTTQKANENTKKVTPVPTDQTHWFRLDLNHKIKSNSKTKPSSSVTSNMNVFYDLFNSMPELRQFQTK
jgi:hypothetical protein